MTLIDGSHVGSGSLAVWTEKEGLQEEVWGKHAHFDSKEAEGGSKSVTKEISKLVLRNMSQQGFLSLPSASTGMPEESLEGPGPSLFLATSLPLYQGLQDMAADLAKSLPDWRE